MHVDFSVELGRDDPTLEIPWSSPDGAIRYQNLKRDSEALNHLPEAASHPELREFLAKLNAKDSQFESAKCDVWSTTEINPEEEIFAEPWKFASYVDLLFSDPDVRNSFARHEQFLKDLTRSLTSAPDIPASTEFILRRCFHRQNDELSEGFYFTAYVFGYGAGESDARENWYAALKRVAHALLNALPSRSSQPPTL